MIRLDLESPNAFIELDASDVCSMSRSDRMFVESIIRLLEDYGKKDTKNGVVEKPI